MALENVHTINADVFKFIKRPFESYDIIFADPPYDHPELKSLPELIFETNDFNTGWDGTIANGRYAQDGLYIYKINYQTCEPNQPNYEITGHVNMLR